MPTADRILNRRGRKHFRRSYSLTEVRIGGVCLVGLAAIAAWVGYRGAHPDPSLFANTPDLLDPGEASVDRGALPVRLGAEGWREGKLSKFDADNLYEKINGRADYFKSRGFRALSFVSLSSGDSPDDTIDLELYDMGSAENARGAYGGERPEAIAPQQHGGDLWHIDRNALFLTSGQHYLRAIGSRESAAVAAQLRHVRRSFHPSERPTSERPWSQALFVSGLGLPVGKIAFAKENAFSFEFASNVYSARRDDDIELFVTVAANDEGARKLAAPFVEGFASLGEHKAAGGIPWVEDRYLHDLSTALGKGRFVLGVRGAKDAASGAEALKQLEGAVAALDDKSKRAALGGQAATAEAQNVGGEEPVQQ
jgi:hypothetical protein